MHIRLYIDVARQLLDTRCRFADARVSDISDTDSCLFSGLERFVRASTGYANADSEPKPELKPDAGKFHRDDISKTSQNN
jgi:hypothetical protein